MSSSCGHVCGCSEILSLRASFRDADHPGHASSLLPGGMLPDSAQGRGVGVSENAILLLKCIDLEAWIPNGAYHHWFMSMQFLETMCFCVCVHVSECEVYAYSVALRYMWHSRSDGSQTHTWYGGRGRRGALAELPRAVGGHC